MGKFILFSGTVALILVCTMVWAPPTEAYEFYQNGGANCTTCHPGFQGGFSGPLHQAHTAFTTECNACHITSPGDTPVPTHEDPPVDGFVGCVGCHGREPAPSNGADWAAGLRLHHTISGIAECAGCHPSDPLPLPEDVLPLYYGTAITSQTDSCADNLDNDGDDLYDGDDPDCQPGCTSDADCDDGLFCNGAETCNIGTGECEPGTPPSCDDGVGCTEDSCDEASDACVNDPNDANCPDDGLFCNGTEFCDEVADCSSTGDPCPPGEICNEDQDICEPAGCATNEDCDDGVACTDDVCDTSSGECSNTANDANCPDDGLFCNGTEFCDEVADCSSTGDPCPPGEICNEDQDICEPAGCATDADCDDGLFCNGAETCNTTTGECEAGMPPSCDDGVNCTDDSCSTMTDACVNDPNDANCPDDGMFCTGTEICDPMADCVSTGDPCPPGEICNEDMDICEVVVGPIEVEIKVPGAINANNNGKTPIHIEFPDSNGDGEVEIAELYCGGDVSNAMAEPWRINADDDDENEFVALFNTRDLMLVCEDTMMICMGTLVDGTPFMGMDGMRVNRDADGRCGGWNGGKKKFLP